MTVVHPLNVAVLLGFDDAFALAPPTPCGCPGWWRIAAITFIHPDFAAFTQVTYDIPMDGRLVNATRLRETGPQR